MLGSTSSTLDDDSGSVAAPEHSENAFEALGSSPDAPRVLVFMAGGHTCACELNAVREIVPCRRATRLPGAPPFVVGVVNLRGSLITVLDLGLHLGAHAAHSSAGSIILVQSGSRVVGLCVDELRDVQRVSREAIETADPEPAHGGAIGGTVRISTELALLLDVPRLVALTFG